MLETTGCQHPLEVRVVEKTPQAVQRSSASQCSSAVQGKRPLAGSLLAGTACRKEE